ncbi:MAG: tyrosine-type recombinase/integrase [Anaerotignaceae bacterium]
MKNHVTGSLAFSGKKYRAMIRVTYKNGNKLQVGHTLDIEYKKGNKGEAKKKLKELMEEYENKNDIDDNIKPFFAYLIWYVELYKDTHSLKTYENYKSMLKSHLIPYFSDKGILLQNLTSGDLEEYFIKKQNEGLAPKTLKNQRALLSVALKFAYKKEFIQKNIVEFLDPIKGADKTYNVETYTAEEIIDLFDLANNEAIIAPVFFACVFGLRRSETLGICFSDFDFENKTFTLNRTVITTTIEGKTTSVIRENTFKSENSKATFPITPFIEAFLYEMISIREENKKLFGNKYNNEYEDFLCIDKQGNLLKPDFISHKFPKILEKYNLRKIRFHDLRHSFITNIQLITSNDKVLQKLARHSDASFTKRKYVHIKEDYCSETFKEYIDSLSNRLSEIIK